MSFSSTAWIVVRRRSLVVSDVNVQIGFVGSTEVASFAMRLQVQMVYKLLNIHYSVELHQFKLKMLKSFHCCSTICAHALNSAHAYHSTLACSIAITLGNGRHYIGSCLVESCSHIALEIMWTLDHPRSESNPRVRHNTVTQAGSVNQLIGVRRV